MVCSLEISQVQDVARTLDAELLFGVQDLDTSMSTEVTNFIVATLQLSDLLKYLPNHCDPSKGSVVIADSSRSDILLSLLHLHESKSFSSVAALVLTGGQRPDEHIELLVKVFVLSSLLLFRHVGLANIRVNELQCLPLEAWRMCIVEHLCNKF